MKYSGVFEKTAVAEPTRYKGNAVPLSDTSNAEKVWANAYKNKAIQDQNKASESQKPAVANANTGFDSTGKRNTYWGYFTGKPQYQPGSAAEAAAQRKTEADDFALQYGLDRTPKNDENNKILRDIGEGRDNISNYDSLRQSDKERYYYLLNKYNAQIAPAMRRQGKLNELNDLEVSDADAKMLYRTMDAKDNATPEQKAWLEQFQKARPDIVGENLDKMLAAGYARQQQGLRNETNVMKVMEDGVEANKQSYNPFLNGTLSGLGYDANGHFGGNVMRELGNRIGDPEAGENLGNGIYAKIADTITLLFKGPMLKSAETHRLAQKMYFEGIGDRSTQTR
ncbi:MAG: hypothetical protein LBT46_14655 [Planctomycetaceae bacterium]|jgi:hypothetical protein|nr:hypothetical protein [Planctomycetaceae bacterium]